MDIDLDSLIFLDRKWNLNDEVVGINVKKIEILSGSVLFEMVSLVIVVSMWNR